MTDLPCQDMQPLGINSHGDFVGVLGRLASDGSYEEGGFRGSGTSASEILWSGIASVAPMDINDNGAIAGRLVTDNGAYGCFVAHDDDDDVRTLRGLPGSDLELVFAINNDETIVGTSLNENGRGIATAYLNGSLDATDLNTLIPSNPGIRLTSALDINSAGQILVEADSHSPASFCVLTPLPEPNVVTVSAIVLTALAMRRG
jgi:hypothetical protein